MIRDLTFAVVVTVVVVLATLGVVFWQAPSGRPAPMSGRRPGER